MAPFWTISGLRGVQTHRGGAWPVWSVGCPAWLSRRGQRATAAEKARQNVPMIQCRLVINHTPPNRKRWVSESRVYIVARLDPARIKRARTADACGGGLPIFDTHPHATFNHFPLPPWKTTCLQGKAVFLSGPCPTSMFVGWRVFYTWSIRENPLDWHRLTVFSFLFPKQCCPGLRRENSDYDQ